MSSSGLERAFSSFSLVYTKLRNWLGNGRVMMLVRTYCHLRDKNNDDHDDLADVEMAHSEKMINQVGWWELQVLLGHLQSQNDDIYCIVIIIVFILLLYVYIMLIITLI